MGKPRKKAGEAAEPTVPHPALSPVATRDPRVPARFVEVMSDVELASTVAACFLAGQFVAKLDADGVKGTRFASMWLEGASLELMAHARKRGGPYFDWLLDGEGGDPFH